MDKTKLTDSDSYYSAQGASLQPLNMETVVRLPLSVKLTQEPNHDANVKIHNTMSFGTCPSCNVHDANQHFQSVPYKTIIQHFENTIAMLEEGEDSRPTMVWPPEDSFLKAAGSVGFGSLPSQLVRDKESNPKRKYSVETHKIPPVIRQIHPKLRAKGYSMYRNDPVFLLKKASCCESCFLSYAEMTSTSFIHMTRPIKPYETDDKEYHYDFPNNENKKTRDGGRKYEASSGVTEASLFGKGFGSTPELPPAIMTPPKVRNEIGIDSVIQTMFLCLWNEKYAFPYFRLQPQSQAAHL